MTPCRSQALAAHAQRESPWKGSDRERAWWRWVVSLRALFTATEQHRFPVRRPPTRSNSIGRRIRQKTPYDSRSVGRGPEFQVDRSD